ncbi:MAG: DUF190 domain-containing protein [Acidobacteria bacterium]|nr:DUF190 domain-containing protein [Acidobacteriota bacterium]
MGRHIEGKLIRIFIGEGDRYERKPLYVAIVHLARELGLGGATVLRGIEGFGADSVVHTARLLRLSEDLPIIVEIVGTEERLAPFLERVETMLDEANCGGLMTVERVEVIRYGPGKS